MKRSKKSNQAGHRKILILVFIAGFFMVLPLVKLWANGGFEYWNQNGMEWQLKKDWKLTFEEELRFNTHGKGLHYEHTDFGVVYAGLAHWLELGVNYRGIARRPEDHWKYDNVPYFFVTLKYSAKGAEFSLRNKIEYSDQQHARDFWRDRPIATIKLPPITRLNVRPYVANEVFLDFSPAKFTENRFYAGLNIPIYKTLSGDIFYVWKCKREEHHWLDTNVVGTKLKLSF